MEQDPTTENVASEDAKQTELQLRTSWGDELPETPIHFCDQMIGSFRGDYVLLSLGQVAQPQPIPGDTVAIAALMEKGTLPVRTQFRAAIPVSDFGAFLRAMIRVGRTHGFLSEPEGTDHGD